LAIAAIFTAFTTRTYVGNITTTNLHSEIKVRKLKKISRPSANILGGRPPGCLHIAASAEILLLHRSHISELYKMSKGYKGVLPEPTQVNTPHLNPSQAGWYSIYLPRRDRRL